MSIVIQIMGHKLMVLVSAAIAAVCPLLSSQFDIPSSMVFSAAIFFLVWLQEIWIIQTVFREENIDFTRKFYQRYPRNGRTRLVGFFPHILSIILISLLWFQIGEKPSTQGWIITVFLFFTSIRIFDPLLGCINTFESIPWTGMLAYFTIFLFATSSALDPSKFDFLSVPSGVTEAFLFVLLVTVIINLRMAYYERFCFLRENRLEGQLKLVLVPLIILSVTQILGILQNLDVVTNLNG